MARDSTDRSPDVTLRAGSPWATSWYRCTDGRTHTHSRLVSLDGRSRRPRGRGRSVRRTRRGRRTHLCGCRAAPPTPSPLGVPRRERRCDPGTEPPVQAHREQRPHEVPQQGRLVPAGLDLRMVVVVDLQRRHRGDRWRMPESSSVTSPARRWMSGFVNNSHVVPASAAPWLAAAANPRFSALRTTVTFGAPSAASSEPVRRCVVHDHDGRDLAFEISQQGAQPVAGVVVHDDGRGIRDARFELRTARSRLGAGAASRPTRNPGGTRTGRSAAARSP